MLPDERPSDEIIEEDDALDAFMKSYMEEKQREAVSSRESKQRGDSGVKDPWSHGETIVMSSNPAYKDM